MVARRNDVEDTDPVSWPQHKVGRRPAKREGCLEICRKYGHVSCYGILTPYQKIVNVGARLQVVGRRDHVGDPQTFPVRERAGSFDVTVKHNAILYDGPNNRNANLIAVAEQKSATSGGRQIHVVHSTVHSGLDSLENDAAQIRLWRVAAGNRDHVCNRFLA